MRILVTGGAGYVGSHVVQALLDAGHEPIVFDNLSTGHAESIRNAELVVGDVADPEQLDQLLERYVFDGCVHLAARSLVGESVRQPAIYYKNNVVGGLTLLDSLVGADVPWIVLSSTAAVYGEPDQVPIPEDHPKRPTNPYGESKLMLEQMLDRYERAYGLSHIALRYFNAAGAHPGGKIGEDHTPETHLIPLVLQVALGQREKVSVFGTDFETTDGTAVRDYVHVCDLADAHIKAIHRLYSGGASGAFNLGTQHGNSVMEVIETARRISEKTIRVELSQRRDGDPAILVASAVQVQRELGWQTRFNLSDIIESAWAWHVSHPTGYVKRSLV